MWKWAIVPHWKNIKFSTNIYSKELTTRFTSFGKKTLWYRRESHYAKSHTRAQRGAESDRVWTSAWWMWVFRPPKIILFWINFYLIILLIFKKVFLHSIIYIASKSFSEDFHILTLAEHNEIFVEHSQTSLYILLWLSDRVTPLYK